MSKGVIVVVGTHEDLKRALSGVSSCYVFVPPGMGDENTQAVMDAAMKVSVKRGKDVIVALEQPFGSLGNHISGSSRYGQMVSVVIVLERAGYRVVKDRYGCMLSRFIG